ncbi:MAG: helix-turn-helix domain-containing protein [Prevotella nigrescens]|uniref:Helix-turn-helix domain-containing protein n=1 Tax=Prevotella nigrescens TaxID=28133 RepID=A0A9D5WWR6_9BACT|nr:helix-turn-helix domain-containing protein [Prevotella nigrescens]MBF1447704.1 helix-turn-helix domain-containing protein [Prevotella nigrescens]
MEFKRTCEWCGKAFMAHCYKTRYCSKQCNGKAYKNALKLKRRQEFMDGEELAKQDKPVEGVQDKPFLTPTETARLLGVGRATVYRYMAQGYIKAKQYRGKTLIRRKDIEKSFDNAPDYKKHRTKRCRKPTSELYTLKEIMQKYEMSRKAVWARCEKYDIPKIYKGRNTFWSKAQVDKYFATIVTDYNKDEWYSPSDIEIRFHMSHAAVLAWAMRNRVPRFHKGKDVYYSKIHVDYLKGVSDIDPDFYTYKEAMDKYGLNMNQVANIVRTKDLTRKQKGGKTVFSRKEFDAQMKVELKDFGIIK